MAWLQSYETQNDLAKEFALARKIEDVFSLKYRKLSPESTVDGYLYRRGSVLAWAELKCRKIRSDSYSTVFINEHKLKRGLFFSQHFGHHRTGQTIPFVFFVRFLDCDLHLKIEREKVREWQIEENFKASNHANDARETKNVVHIPIELMKQF